MNRVFSIILLLLLNVSMFGQTPDYQNNGWKEWYFSNGNVACKVYQRPNDMGITCYHLTPEPNGYMIADASAGWRYVGTEGKYELYEPWRFEFKCNVYTGSMWNEWTTKEMNDIVLKIAKDWSEIVYPKNGLPWYSQVHIYRVSQEKYKETVRAQEESLRKAQAKYGSGNYGNGGSASSNGGSSINNSSSGNSLYTTCRICNGSGRCTSCRGTGTGMYTYGGTSHSSCSSCNGSGRCFNCHGTGRQ